jgi:hypothetical protein
MAYRHASKVLQPQGVYVTARKKKSTKVPLKDFVENEKKSKQCFLCSIPELKEIEEAKQGGAETRYIVKWLIEDRGYDEDRVKAARGMMGHHFATHMVRRKGKDDWEATL